ncbi:hypothetical protein QBC37DRAFT_478281 [Rhypophila decipiens]|uniref:gamma-glutamylcyclotransferase n=1 Tax=Rhypophila decipiens TaxID=261697 RepID=A0AAN6YGY0_9PEZI|nr:hypothetical protein QBC37DRAFT_478281 [Rhypophila decipiens]
MSSSTTSNEVQDQAQAQAPGNGAADNNWNGKRLYFGYGSNLWHKQMAQRCPGAEFLGIARLSGYQWMINKRGYATIAKVDNPSSDPGSDSGGGGGGGSSSTSGSDEVDRGDEDEVVEIENVDHKNTVWGAVWSLTPDDEKALDKDEGVPFVYEKREVDEIEFWAGDVRRFLQNPAAIIAEIEGYANKKYNSNKKKEKEKYKYKRLGKPEMVSMLVYIDFRHNRPGAAAKEEYHHRMQMAIWDALEMGIPSSYVKCVLTATCEKG